MGRLVGWLIIVALGLVLAGEVAAQTRPAPPRVVVPIIIRPGASAPAPAGGTASTAVTVQGTQGAAGFAGAPAPVRSFATSPGAGTTRIVVEEQRVANPGPRGTTETRVIIREVPRGAAGFFGSAPIRGFDSSSTSSDTTRIVIQEERGTGASKEIRVFLEDGRNGSGIETPIVIVPD